ncbi:MAG: DUF2058 family protein [Xanthomonadales bacterium]|jgi:uncharacterized protein YaiL (DUF2058 family)|nr:DUF2058 family protein [Xanthomonadales bacterium]
MADSLQDQLRALGLAKERAKGGNKKAPRKHGKSRGQGHSATARPSGRNPAERDGSAEMPLGKAWAIREREEKKTIEQKRARKQEEDRKRREINKAIKEIIKGKRLNKDDAEVARNFMYRSRIRKVYVTAEQNRALAEGDLGLVYLSGGYHLLDKELTEAVRKIAADHVVELDSGSSEEEEDFPVPDDLVW